MRIPFISGKRESVPVETNDRRKEFIQFLKKLNISPKHVELYELAFLHRSASFVLLDGTSVNNERLEYLGDAIIDAVVADFLFRKFPKEKEGFLTKTRSRIVNRNHLDLVASKMGLEGAVVIRKNTGKKRVCGDVLEALIGAIYLDYGFERARTFLTEHVLNPCIDGENIALLDNDFKSRFLEWGQKYKVTITFTTLEGAPNKPFIVQAMVGDMPMTRGEGQSKKAAEQNASQKALAYIKSPEFSLPDFLNYIGKKTIT